MDKLNKIIDIMSILGIPSIFVMVIYCIKSVRNYTNKLNVLLNAQQAQMRSQLLEQYHYYMDGGWISEEHMAEWENRYQAYHSLGKNGVLDARREDLLNLPNHNINQEDSK